MSLKIKKLPDLLLSILLTLIFALLQLWQPNWLNRLDGIAYDNKLNYFPIVQQNSTTNIQIVDIDEKSLNMLGRWPWPRSTLATMVNNLTEQGAVVIAFDMLFSEPQQNPVVEVQKLLPINQAKQLEPIKYTLDSDYHLAQSFSQVDVVLGSLFLNDNSISKGQIQAPKLIQNQPKLNHEVLKFSGVKANIATLNQASQGQGFMNAIADADGFIRSAALIAEYQSKLYPALALETYRVYSFANSIEPIWHINKQSALISGLKIGAAFIPTDNRGSVLIPYKGPAKTYPYTSAVDVIQKKITDKRFDQAVVFVGTSTVGMADLRTTPVSLVYPGIEIHATVFDALMNPDTLASKPDYWLAANMVFIVLLGLMLAIILPRLEPLSMTIFIVLLLAGMLIGNITLYQYYHLHFPIVVPLLLVITLAVTTFSEGFFRENKQRKKVKAIFDQYVPPAHIEKLLDQKNSDMLSGSKKELSVLFADIRGFTTLSETLSPNQLKQLLNDYFSPITEIIFENHGTIDKYVGDMVMAFWGAPLDDNQHSNHAVKTAFMMLDCTKQLSQQFKQQGLPEIQIGVGINSGEMNVGDMGSKFRRAYTVLGDAVNLGSRLESLTKFYGVNCLVSEFTKQQANNYHYQIIDKVKVKGKSQSVAIYLPLKAPSQLAEQFNQIHQLYCQQQWQKSLNLLHDWHQQGGQQRLYQLYLQRIEYFIENPPEQSFDGTYTHSSK